MNVVKRDGRIVKFDKYKIVDAVFNAFKSVDGEITEYAEIKAGNIADYIADKAEKADHDLTIEEIQNYVEQGLQSTKRKDVAKEYIIYREDRTRERKNRSKVAKEYGEKLRGNNEEKQNANIDAKSFGGRMGEAAEVYSKEYALDNLLSSKARYNHINNIIYTHDLGSYAVGMHNCLSMPFDDLLANGFKTRQADVRTAGSINTAMQLLAVGFQLQSLDQFGGVSATHLDWTMVPYVRKSFWKHFKDGLKYIETKVEDFSNLITFDNSENMSIDNDTQKTIFPNAYKYAMDMTIKECEQAVEGMYHNLNTLQSRSGNQLPFTSINYGTCTLPEGRMITKALLEGCIKGTGKHHKTSIFPCGIFQKMKGVNDKGSPNYDLYQLALKSTSQRLYPNYANCDWSGNAGYDINDPRTYFSTMGCRTANGWDANGFGQLKDGRGNICPVTLILPTIAMMAKENCSEIFDDIEDYFIKLLDKYINEAKEQLIDRFNYIASQSPDSGKFMYENNTMAGYVPEKGILSALCHGTLAIGQIGLAEALQILIGCDHAETKGMELAKRIEKLFREKCDEFKKETYIAEDINGEEWTYHLNFGVYYTPAENLCYTSMKKFQDKYGVIENVSDKDFFTNSIHVPVWKEISPIEKINIESQLTGYSNAGCITYVELDGGVKNNLDALETLVDYAMEKDIPYFAVNVPVDTCEDCGYSDEMNDTCPMCGGHNIMHLRRVTGYLTGDYETAFNEGKQQETRMRYKHSRKIPGWHV